MEAAERNIHDGIDDPTRRYQRSPPGMVVGIRTTGRTVRINQHVARIARAIPDLKHPRLLLVGAWHPQHGQRSLATLVCRNDGTVLAWHGWDSLKTPELLPLSKAIRSNDPLHDTSNLACLQWPHASAAILLAQGVTPLEYVEIMTSTEGIRTSRPHPVHTAIPYTYLPFDPPTGIDVNAYQPKGLD